jgi:hypothetical protein
MSNAVGAGVKPAPTASFAVSACLPAETKCFRLDYAAGFLILSDVEVIEGLPDWPVTRDPHSHRERVAGVAGVAGVVGVVGIRQTQ